MKVLIIKHLLFVSILGGIVFYSFHQVSFPQELLHSNIKILEPAENSSVAPDNEKISFQFLGRRHKPDKKLLPRSSFP